ncbi:hypothetical protein Esti_002952 [Eimeria stiedai]
MGNTCRSQPAEGGEGSARAPPPAARRSSKRLRFIELPSHQLCLACPCPVAAAAVAAAGGVAVAAARSRAPTPSGAAAAKANVVEGSIALQAASLPESASVHLLPEAPSNVETGKKEWGRSSSSNNRPGSVYSTEAAPTAAPPGVPAGRKQDKERPCRAAAASAEAAATHPAPSLGLKTGAPLEAPTGNSGSSSNSAQKRAGAAAAATAAAADALGEEAAAETRKTGPLVLLVTGMAGSGKSTLVKAMDEHLRALGKRTYLINLDPAVTSLAFAANVDIRDSVNYKRVMQHYKLGPNGGILTALNLFATKFGALLLLLQQRSSTGSSSIGGLDYVLVDTPGQIEVFTWSASGSLITEALAATFPTCIVYTVDACRSQAPNTLLSNMVHACSVLYRHKLPFLAAFNKIDAQENSRCIEWVKDYDLFQEALLEDDRYMGSLGRSTALALCSFYENIEILPLSAVTKQGFEELPVHLEKLRREYQESFLPYLMEQRLAAQQRKLRQQQEQLKRFAADSSSSKSSSSERAVDSAAAAAPPSVKRDAAC